jgi:branched-chain amino acid transport system permease protein
MTAWEFCRAFSLIRDEPAGKVSRGFSREAKSMVLQQVPQFLVSGITNGSIYALIAFGLCLIQNATGLVNFAQGDFVMLGAMIMISLLQVAHLPLMVALPLAVAAVAVIGVLLEGGPIRHSRNRDVLTLVMITVGASIFFRGGGMLVWGKNAFILPAWGGDQPIVVGYAAILPQVLWIIGLSLVVLLVLYGFFHKTLVGKAMRAVADNPQGAALIGLSVHRLVALAFAMSGALGALAGILVTPLTSMNYEGGLMLGLKGFAAAILGGYGSAVGAVVGGLLLGILESLGAGLISSAYKDAFAFLILLSILFLRPAGILGSVRVRRL